MSEIPCQETNKTKMIDLATIDGIGSHHSSAAINLGVDAEHVASQRCDLIRA